MENNDTQTSNRGRSQWLLPASIVIAAAFISGAWLFTNGFGRASISDADPVDPSTFEKVVLPPEGRELPARWGDLGAQLISAGVIDRAKFDALYTARGGLNDDERALLEGTDNGNLVITPNNAGILLNLLWALGLANTDPILDDGPMQDPQYGGAGGFASTGGWSLASGNAMDHFSRHAFFTLTKEQQALVEEVAKNIYRPCCNNPTHFPDCNHGMAMLGLLELMASQGASEDELYDAALAVNAYWFPDTYLTIAAYLEKNGSSWEKSDPKELLGASFSSASGFQRITSELTPASGRGGNSCGV